MKRTMLCFALLALLIAPALFAQSAAGGDVIKIGVINTQKILEESKIGKSIISDLEALRDRRKKELDNLKAEIDSLKRELETQANLLSQEAKREKEDALLKKQTGLRRNAEDFDKELRVKQDNALKEITGKIEKILKAIGKEQGYTIILNEAVALYFSTDIDITNEVIQRLNAQT